MAARLCLRRIMRWSEGGVPQEQARSGPVAGLMSEVVAAWAGGAQRPGDRVEQRGAVDRFAKERYRLHRVGLASGFRIVISGDDDDRQVYAERLELCLELLTR